MTLSSLRFALLIRHALLCAAAGFVIGMAVGFTSGIQLGVYLSESYLSNHTNCVPAILVK